MATNQNTKRKDKARVVLRKGESQRKDGKYDFRWTSPDGKRHSIYAATLEELREKENDIQRDSLEGIKAEARYVTLNDVFTLWAQVKRGLKDNTFQNYLYLYRQFVEPDFGKSKVSALKKSDVKQFYNTLADERGLQVSTIDSVHTVLHQVLDMAVDDCYLRSNPSDNVLKELKKSHQFETNRRKALTVAEQNLLLSFSQSVSVLKTRELTQTRIQRALLHIILNIHTAPTQIPFARVLGFRKESSELLSRIKQHSRIPLITKLADAQNLLDSEGNQILSETVFSSNLYEKLLCLKTGRKFCHESQKQLIIL